MTNFLDFLSLFDTFKPFRSKIDAFSLLEPFFDRSQSPKGFKLFFDTKIHFHWQFHEFFRLWEHSEAFTETWSPFFSKIVAFYTFHHVENFIWQIACDIALLKSRLGLSRSFWTFLDTSITKIRFLHDNWTLPRPPKAVFKLFKGFKVQKFAI